ncbi:putative AB5 enterotoxin binding subunit YtxB [Yersinia intermedia]|uniref:putative AB5 enterotoxin binding subunit YtxB n=1 Tax=Yersinia intermedia TaxID=631 RepID=UPI00124A6C91|nr:putative AB5 enterotoxin binding subunit YtxB [Yersinia intermedia]MCW8110337.1 putative AB5 enterotoxin binding subunit YtxB [Yersinia intermedia]MDA5514944.1 putative AB5 enterotoxin binding subunit YtxB [Yersinia intermedia]
MRLYIKLMLLLSVLFHGAAFSETEMKKQCEKDSGTMIYNKPIQGYNASIMWRPSESTNSTFNAIGVKIEGGWYGTIAEDRINGNSSLGLSSLAQAAYLIGMPINACVKDKYLRGLEGVN